jgi:hypothetical protein
MLVLCAAIVSAVLFTNTSWRRDKVFRTVHQIRDIARSIVHLNYNIARLCRSLAWRWPDQISP